MGHCSAQNATQYVFDMYKNVPSLDADAVIDLMASAQPGITFPLNHEIPNTGFDCAAQKTTGYFADPAPPSLCQVFYRCDTSGNQTGFLCSNQTLFNQLTLTCDYYWNVDCASSKSLYNFGNSRLYNGTQPLFDTPPKGYVSLLSGLSPQDERATANQGKAPSSRADETAPAKAAPTTLSAVLTPKPPVNRPVNVVVVFATTQPPATTTTTATSTTTTTITAAVVTDAPTTVEPSTTTSILPSEAPTTVAVVATTLAPASAAAATEALTVAPVVTTVASASSTEATTVSASTASVAATLAGTADAAGVAAREAAVPTAAPGGGVSSTEVVKPTGGPNHEVVADLHAHMALAEADVKSAVVIGGAAVSGGKDSGDTTAASAVPAATSSSVASVADSGAKVVSTAAPLNGVTIAPANTNSTS
ncbi:hypothetical protein BV898_01636 [Hypsibius exemplaris]|uniref:Chitin-binding type-2 domain-containing protein n=1 Tax=Hypsibius exemplaris TaxID=2072580 RepID=A0A1W0XAL6_HYPEX|nr:hypothetical protein BV898_01636 [Hypsibius exemplaris]